MKRKMTLLVSLVMIFTLMLSGCSGGGESPEKLESTYSIIDFPQGSLIVVKDDETNLCGGVDGSGNLAVPCEYNSLEYIGSGSFGDRYSATKKDKYGTIDGDGNVIIPCEYDSIQYPAINMTETSSELTDDLVVIEKDGKAGYCSLKDGAVVIEPTFTFANCFQGEELASVVSEDGQTEYISRTGDKVNLGNYSEAGDFNDGVAMVRDEKGKLGVIDTQGKPLIPCRYDDFLEYYDGGHAVFMEGNDEDGYRNIAVDSVGNEILSSNNPISMCGNLFGEYVDDSYHILYDRKGDKVTDKKYSEITVMAEGTALIVYDMNEKAGLLDQNGNELLPCQYSRIEEIFYDAETGKQLWEVRFAEDGYCKLINEKGEEIPTGDYSEIGRFSETGLAPVLHEGKVGFIDMSGKEVVPCEYYPATWYGQEPEEGFMLDSYNLSAVRKEGEDHYAIMDANGKVVTDYKYSYVRETTEESEEYLDVQSAFRIMVVRDDGNKFGVVSLDGKEISPCGSFYAVGKAFSNGLIPVKESEDSLWSLMNMDGKIVSKPVFDRTFDQY
ncbi:MAG: WG repeat-containing protein [Eubacterium sp.]|nr:WG repeat-containing protein [Eubacterium sp.]